MERGFPEGHEGLSQRETKEAERPPRLELWITRHANRTPEGALTLEGLEAITTKGQALRGAAEVVKGRSSKEKSDRAYKTGEGISRESETISSRTGEPYATRRRQGLFYGVTGPLMDRIKAQSEAIDAAAKRAYPDYDPTDPQWAKVRETFQPLGLQAIITDAELMHPMAMGLAHNVQQAETVGSTYVRRRQQAVTDQIPEARPITKDIILTTNTHGMFAEALIQRAFIRQTPDGERRGFTVAQDKEGQNQLEPALGGIITPTESIRFGHSITEPTPERVPVTFERERFPGEQVFLDMPTVKMLAEQYRKYVEVLQRWERGEVTKEIFGVELRLLINEFDEWVAKRDEKAWLHDK